MPNALDAVIGINAGQRPELSNRVGQGSHAATNLSGDIIDAEPACGSQIEHGGADCPCQPSIGRGRHAIVDRLQRFHVVLRGGSIITLNIG